MIEMSARTARPLTLDLGMLVIGLAMGGILGAGAAMWHVRDVVTKALRDTRRANAAIAQQERVVRMADCMLSLISPPPDSHWWKERRENAHRIPLVREMCS